jgi:hypothetical protein
MSKNFLSTFENAQNKLFELKNFMEHFRILTIVDLSFVGTS